MTDRRRIQSRYMRPVGRFLLPAAVSAALVAGAGCPSKKAKHARTPGVCKADKDCNAGKHCVNGRCVQCADDQHCPAGRICRSGQCLKRCERDGDCGHGQICDEGACRTSVCRSDLDCPAGRKCRGGQCSRLLSGECVEDDDCSEEEVCRKGRCVTVPPPAPPPVVCSLEQVHFDYNRFTLRADARDTLLRNADCLRKVKNRKVRLEGHCDPRGTEEYNLALSNSRAQSVKEYLERLGIEDSRFRVVPKGELEATGIDEAGWARDRKVVFVWE